MHVCQRGGGGGGGERGGDVYYYSLLTIQIPDSLDFKSPVHSMSCITLNKSLHNSRPQFTVSQGYNPKSLIQKLF